MTEKRLDDPTNMSPNGLADRMVSQTLRAINDADNSAAVSHVEKLRCERGESNDDLLVEHLIKQKALRTGMVGAVTSGASIIPGLGTLAAFTLGVATDVGVTMRLQSELVLEVAAARGHQLSEDERRKAIMIVTGVNLGAERLVNQTSRKLADKAIQRFGGRAFVKAIPFVGIAVSAAANMVTTYVVGRRANAYFGLGPDALQDYSESIRALSGVDERKLLEWLTSCAVDHRRFPGSRQPPRRPECG